MSGCACRAFLALLYPNVVFDAIFYIVKANGVYLPYTLPSVCSILAEVDEYGETFGLTSSEDGTAVRQEVAQLIPHVITRDIGRQPDLSTFTSQNPFMVVLQGDAARRGVKCFSQWVLKNPYLDSQSPKLLHLFALGVKKKDNQDDTLVTWGEEAEPLASVVGRTWEVVAPMGEGGQLLRYEVPTTLTATVDLAAERELWGIIGGCCHCQGHHMQHRVPAQRRTRLNTIAQVLEWCCVCEEPETVEE